jgi:hypothetical protein
MATNISHVHKAAHALYDTVGKAIEAIENKENEGEHDSERIEAYQDFLTMVEEQLDELNTTLEELKG